VTRRPPVSACVITRNEGRRLAACLDRLRWADEIVVVDDESTDDTREVAARSGARVLVRAKTGDFAAQRNFALDQATGDWVLFVDADEEVGDALRDEILGAVRHPGVVAWRVPREDHHFGQVFRHGESRSVPLLRLARRDAGRWHGRVHEEWRVAGSTGVLREALIHRSHADIAEFVEKVNYYTTLAADRLAEEGRSGAAWQLVVYPLGSFLRNYVVRRGFLDGVSGFVLAVLMTLHPFLARAKLWRRHVGPTSP
jgi:glycosyltransferase involved in cell wall biosynthesis